MASLCNHLAAPALLASNSPDRARRKEPTNKVQPIPQTHTDHIPTLDTDTLQLLCKLLHIRRQFGVREVSGVGAGDSDRFGVTRRAGGAQSGE